MNLRNLGGVIGIIGGVGLIGFGMWMTNSVQPLWALLLLVVFVNNFPWEKSSKNP